MNPLCPHCSLRMTGGAPHGEWALQFECHYCGLYLTGANMADIERARLLKKRRYDAETAERLTKQFAPKGNTLFDGLDA